MIETGTPVTVGMPLGNLSMRSCAASQANSPSSAIAGEQSRARCLRPACSPMPRICVEPPVAHFRPTSDRPRRMKRKASVTMKDGSRVRMTIWPLMAPRTRRERQRREDGREAAAGREQQEGAEDQPGEGHHRADGKIELAADHQQRGGDGEDAELRGRRQDVHDPREREHRRIGGGEEEDGDEDQARSSAEFGSAHQRVVRTRRS